MKKLLLSLVSLAAVFFYALSQSQNSSSKPPQPTTQTIKLADTPAPSPSTPQKPIKYGNGTFSGDVADAVYGNLQVEAKISGGKLVDISFIQYPNDRAHSIEVNNYAMPILKSEAIKAQSAQVDIVSGATQTSQAFQQSLQSALIKSE